MQKSFKTEINPTMEQKTRINKTIGTCRYVYNFYLAHNKALYEAGEEFMTGRSFSVWLNNEYIPGNPDKAWIKEAYSKAVKKSVEDLKAAGFNAYSYVSEGTAHEFLTWRRSLQEMAQLLFK